MPVRSVGPGAKRNSACPPGFVPMNQVDPVLLDLIKATPEFASNRKGGFVRKWLVSWAEKKEVVASKNGSRPLTIEDIAYYINHPLLDAALALCGITECTTFECDTGCPHDLWTETERPQQLGWYLGKYTYKNGCAAFAELDQYDQGYGRLFDRFGEDVIHTAFEGVAIAQVKWHAARFDFVKSAVKSGSSYADATDRYDFDHPFPYVTAPTRHSKVAKAPAADAVALILENIPDAVSNAVETTAAPETIVPVVEETPKAVSAAVAEATAVPKVAAPAPIKALFASAGFTALPTLSGVGPVLPAINDDDKVGLGGTGVEASSPPAIEHKPMTFVKAVAEVVAEQTEVTLPEAETALDDSAERDYVVNLFDEFGVDKEKYKGHLELWIEDLVEERGDKEQLKCTKKYFRSDIKHFSKVIKEKCKKNSHACIPPPKHLTKTKGSLVIPHKPTFGPYSNDVGYAHKFMKNADSNFDSLEADTKNKSWLNIHTQEDSDKSGFGYAYNKPTNDSVPTGGRFPLIAFVSGGVVNPTMSNETGYEPINKPKSKSSPYSGLNSRMYVKAGEPAPLVGMDFLVADPDEVIATKEPFSSFEGAIPAEAAESAAPKSTADVVMSEPDVIVEIKAAELPILPAVATDIISVAEEPFIAVTRKSTKTAPVKVKAVPAKAKVTIPRPSNVRPTEINPRVVKPKVEKVELARVKAQQIKAKKSASASRSYESGDLVVTGNFELPFALPPMKTVLIKDRKAAFYSTDPNLAYYHDKVNYITNSNIPLLDDCIAKVNARFKTEFNSVLVQKYCPDAAIPFHRDNEDCYDNDPILTYNVSGDAVFSISNKKPFIQREFKLSPGDFVLMTAAGSKLRHSVRTLNERISLTFRVQRRQLSDFKTRSKSFNFFPTDIKPTTSEDVTKQVVVPIKASAVASEKEVEVSTSSPPAIVASEDVNDLCTFKKTGFCFLRDCESCKAEAPTGDLTCPPTPHNTPVSNDEVKLCTFASAGFCFISGCDECSDDSPSESPSSKSPTCSLQNGGIICDCSECVPEKGSSGSANSEPLFWGSIPTVGEVEETIIVDPTSVEVLPPAEVEVICEDPTDAPATPQGYESDPQMIPLNSGAPVGGATDSSKDTNSKVEARVITTKATIAKVEPTVQTKAPLKPKPKPTKPKRAARPFVVVKDRAKFLGNQRAIPVGNGWYIVIHKSLYYSVRDKLPEKRRQGMPSHPDSFYKALLDIAEGTKTERLRSKKEKQNAWIFSTSNTKKCLESQKHWNYSARAAGLAGLYDKFREHMKSEEVSKLKPTVKRAAPREVKPKDDLPHFSLYKKEITKKSLDQLIGHVDVLHDNNNLTDNQRKRLVGLVKQRIFLKKFFSKDKLIETKKLTVDVNDKKMLEKRMPQYGWESLSLSEISGNSMKDLKAKGKLNQKRLCASCSKTIFIKEASTADGTFIYGKCSSYKCGQYCRPEKMKPCPKCDEPLDARYRECIRCFQINRSVQKPVAFKTKPVEAIRAHSTELSELDLDILADITVPFAGSFCGVHWRKGNNSNITENVRTIHTDEGWAPKPDWQVHLPDIHAKYPFAPLDPIDPIMVPVGKRHIKPFSINGTGWFRKEVCGWLYSYQYYTFYSADNLVSGTPIFQNSKMVSTITYSCGAGNYVIMTDKPINSTKYEVGSYNGMEESDSFGMCSSYSQGSEFDTPSDVYMNSSLVMAKGIVYLLRWDFNNRLVTRLIINQANSVEADHPHCLTPRQGPKKRVAPLWKTLMILFATTVAAVPGGKLPLPLSRIAPASTPTTSTSTTTSRTTPKSGEGPVSSEATIASDLLLSAGGKFYPLLASKAPDTDVVTWDPKLGTKCAATLGDLRSLISKIGAFDDKISTQFRADFTLGTLPKPDDFLVSIVNDMVKSMNSARGKIGNNAYTEAPGGIPARLSTLKEVRDDLRQWNSACKTLNILSSTFGYSFDEPCLSNGDAISDLEAKAENYIKFLTEALAISHEDEEQLDMALNVYMNAVVAFKDLVLANSEDIPIPLFVVVRGNLASIPMYDVDLIRTKYPDLKSGIAFLQSSAKELDIMHQVLLSYLGDDQKQFAVPEAASRLFSLLTASPSQVHLKDGKKAYLAKPRRGNSVVECYNSGPEGVCTLPRGSIIGSDSNNPEIEKAVKTFRPTVSVISNEEPTQQTPAADNGTTDADQPPIVYTTNVMGIIKAGIVVIIGIAAYETEGAAAAVAMLILGFLLTVNACNPDLVMIQGSRNGPNDQWHTWGSIGVGQCVKFGDSVVMIDGIKVEQNIEKLFSTANNYRAFAKSKYGCPFGDERSICNDKLGCDADNQMERSFCTSAYNGAFTKTDCMFPGTLWSNVAVCMAATGEIVTVYKLTGDIRVTVDYSIFRNGEKTNGTFVQGTQYMSGAEFSVMEIERKSPFDFDHVAFQPGHTNEQPRFIEINKGVDVSGWCKIAIIKGRYNFEDPNCLDIRVTQHGSDVDVILPGMGVTRAISRGDARVIASGVVGMNSNRTAVFRIVKWFNGHLLFTAKPVITITPRCVLDARPEVKVTPLNKVYKHNQLEVLTTESNCKISLTAKQCYIHGTEVINVTTQRAVTILICPYATSDTLTVEGEHVHEFTLTGLNVEYNYVFHSMEDRVIRTVTNSSIISAIASVLDNIPNPILTVFSNVKKFLYISTVVVCGLIGVVVGVNIMTRWRSYGAIFIIAVVASSGVLLTAAESLPLGDSCLRNISHLPSKGVLACDIVGASHTFAKISNTLKMSIHDLLSLYCRDGAILGYNATEFATMLLSDCAPVTSGAHPGARPILSIGFLSFIGANVSGHFQTALYVVCGFIFVQYLYECVLIIRSFQRIVASLFDILRSDFERVAFVSDVCSSALLIASLWQFVGWSAIFIVYTAQRPLIFEVARACAFNGTKISNSFGHWWWSALIASKWPKKRTVREHQIVRGRYTTISCPPEIASTTTLYGVEQHSVIKVDAGKLVKLCSGKQDFRNCVFYDSGRRAFYYHKLEGTICAPAHALTGDLSSWGFNGDLAYYPAENSFITSRFVSTDDIEDELIRVVGGGLNEVTIARLVVARNTVFRVERQWTFGDSGLTVFVKQQGYKLWMHSGSPHTNKSISLSTSSDYMPIEVEYHSGASSSSGAISSAEAPIKTRQEVRMEQRNRRRQVVSPATVSDKLKEKVADLAGKLKDKVTGSEAQDTPAPARGRSQTRRETPRNRAGSVATSKTKGEGAIRRAQSTSPTRKSRPRVYHVSVDTLISSKAKVGEATIKGQTVVRHHGVATSKLARDYEKIDTPVITRRPVNRRPQRDLAASRVSRAVRLEKEVKHNLIPKEVLACLQKVVPDFKMQYWTNSAFSKEELDAKARKGETILQATTENFLRHSIGHYDTVTQRNLFDAVAKYAETTAVGSSTGRIADKDYGKLAAICDNIQFQKAGKASEAMAKATGKEVHVVQHEVVTPSGSFSYKTVSAKAKPKKMASSTVTASSILDSVGDMSGAFSLEDDEGNVICRGISIEGVICLPAHAVVVDEGNWYQANDLLVEHPDAFDFFTTQAEALYFNKVEDLSPQEGLETIGLRADGLYLTDREFRKGDSGLVFVTPQGKHVMFGGTQEDEDVKTFDVLSLPEDPCEVTGDGKLFYYLIESFPWSRADSVPSEIIADHQTQYKLGTIDEEDEEDDSDSIQEIDEPEESTSDIEVLIEPPTVQSSYLTEDELIQNQSRSDLSADEWAVFDEEMGQQYKDRKEMAMEQLAPMYSDSVNREAINDLQEFYEHVVIPKLQKYKGKLPLDTPNVFWTILSLFDPNLFDIVKIRTYAKTNNLGTLVSFVDGVSGSREYCSVAHKGETCKKYRSFYDFPGGKSCLQASILQHNYIPFLCEKEDVTKSILLWILSVEFTPNVSPTGVHWSTETYDPILKNILSVVSTSTFCELLSWHIERSVVLPQAHLDFGGKLKMTPSAVSWAQNFLTHSTAAHSDIYNCFFPSAKKDKDTRIVIDRQGSWVRNESVIRLAKFSGSTSGWGFIYRGVFYSCYHVTRGRDVEITVFTNDEGTAIRLVTEPPTITSSCLFKSTEVRTTYRGDICVYSTPGMNTTWDRPVVGEIYLLINPELHKFATLLCTGSAAGAAELSETTQMVDHFAFVSITKENLIEAVPFTDYTKGWSGLPILSNKGACVGIFGFLRTLSTATPEGIVDRPESARPTVHTSQHDITSQAGEVLAQSRAATACSKWLRVSAPTGAGKSTRLVRAMGEELLKKLKKRSVDIRVCVPTVFTVNNLFDGMCMLVSQDKSAEGRVNILRHHGQLKKEDKTSLLTSDRAATACINITYCTYGSYVKSCLRSQKPDLLVLDEIHTRIPDVLAVETILKYHNRWAQVITMTATSWPASPTNDIFIDFSIGTSKRHPIEEKIIKKWEEIPSGEEIQYYRILGVDGKDYALPRDHCAADCKTLVFMATINQCKRAMEKLAQDNTGVGTMILTSKNKNERVPEGRVIIFCTEVAESGVTIPNCDNVVDFRRCMRPCTDLGFSEEGGGGLQYSYTMIPMEINVCSATQRKGRTGRTNAGNYWTCDSNPLRAMHDRPPDSVFEIALTMLKNEEIVRFSTTKDEWDDAVMEFVRYLRPTHLAQFRNFHPILNDGRVSTMLSDEETIKIFEMKLEVLQSVNVIDPIAWYLIPNYPRSWVEDGNDVAIAGNNVALTEMSKRIRDHLNTFAMPDTEWRQSMKDRSLQFNISLVDKMEDPRWVDEDETVRRKFRSESVTGVKLHSLGSLWWGGSEALLAIGATGFIFSQFYEVMYGTKKPVGLYQLHCGKIDAFSQCYEYLNRAKLTTRNCSDLEYWVECLTGAVETSIRTVTHTLPTTNPLRKWFDKNFPKVKTHSGLNDIWLRCLDHLERAWSEFSKCLPTDRAELMHSWIGSGSISLYGTFYDQWVAELSPFGAFLFAIAIGGLATTVVCTGQFVGACLIGGMGYLVAHWWNKPATPNKYLALQKEYGPKNRLIQFATGTILGNLITNFFVPMVSEHQDKVYERMMLTMGGVSAQKAAVTTSANSINFKTIFTPSASSNVYNMYIQLGQVWSGKTDIYSAEGLSALLTSYGGFTSIFSLDFGSLLTLATVAGVDWLCNQADKNIEQTWFRQYGCLKPGGKLEDAFFTGSELEKADRMSTIRRVQSILHCIVASGLNPINVLPALMITLAKKVYEGECKISTSDLIDSYMRAVTTHPFVLLINIAWSVWSKLKEASDSSVGVKLNSEAGTIAWLMGIKDRISDSIRKACEDLWQFCKDNSRTLRIARRVFCGGVKLLYNFAGWLGSMFVSKMSNVVSNITDSIAKSIVRQIVPTFWLKYVAKTRAPLKATEEDVPSDLTRFFHLYGMGSLLVHCQALLTNRHYSDATCEWQITSIRDLKLWRTLQRVVMRSNLSEVSQVLSSLRVHSTDTTGWYITDRPIEIQKYLVSCLAAQVSLDVNTFVDDEIEDQCINGKVHFNLFWNEKFTLTVFRSTCLRSVFLLLTDGIKGVIFSWRFDIPRQITDYCKAYRPDYVTYQKEMVETLLTCKGDFAFKGLLQTTYPQLVDVGWDDILHDLAFSQANIPDMKKLLYVALNVTPLDAELAKLKNHDSRVDRVINDFSLEKLGVFKGIERSWGWRAGFDQEFSSLRLGHLDADPKAVAISHADLRHYGLMPGLAKFACRVEPLDFGVNDILAWTHVVSGLPAARRELDQKGWKICHELTGFSVGSPFIEVCNWGFKLHFLHKSMCGRNLKQLSAAINSLRVFKNEASWHEALNDTRKRETFITDVAKYNVNPSRYFTCLRTDQPYTRDYKITDRCAIYEGKVIVAENTLDDLLLEYPRCISREVLTYKITAKSEQVAQVKGTTANGKDLYISLRFMCNLGVVVSLGLTNITLMIPSTEQLTPSDIAKLIVNSCALEYTDTAILNAETKTWFYAYTAYGEIIGAFGPNVNPWVVVHVDPSRDVCVDQIFVDRNPDWVFVAMLGNPQTSEESVAAHAEVIKESIQGYLNDLDELSTERISIAKVSIIDEDLIRSQNFNSVCDGSFHQTLVTQNPQGLWGEGYDKCRTQIKGIDTQGDVLHQINLETVRDHFSTRKINIKATSLQPDGPKNHFLRAMASSQCISGRQVPVEGVIDDRDIADRKLAVKLARAQYFGNKVTIAKGRIERAYHVAGSGVDLVVNAAKKLSTLASFRKTPEVAAKTHGIRNIFQVIVDAANPYADYKWENKSGGPTTRQMKIEMEYMKMLAEHQKSLDPFQGETSSTVAEALMRKQTLQEIVENLNMPVQEDIERAGIESGGIVHFSYVSKRSLPSLPFVGSSFASVEVSQELLKSKAFTLEEVTSYRKAEQLPQGCSIVPIQRSTRIPNNGTVSLAALSQALARVDHIKQPLWDAMVNYNRVCKPRNTELNTASRGWPKCQVMDRDLGLWSSASVYYDMTAGFGGFSEYYTHCPPLARVVNGEVVEICGKPKTLIFNSLIHPGHAAPVVDKIVNPDNPKISVKMLNPVDGHGSNGDIRDSRLLELVREVATNTPPQLMSFDAGEASPNLTAEASWQTRELPMSPDLEMHAFTRTFAGAVEVYLQFIAAGGSAVIKMMGFTDTTVDLIQRYSKGFTSLICYKNPTTSLASREWYLVLLGRNPKLDDHVQLCMDEHGRVSAELPSLFGETLESDAKKIRYFVGVDKLLRQEKFEDFRFSDLVMNMRIEWLRAFNGFADWARRNYSAIQADLQKFGNNNHSLGEGLIITKTGEAVDPARWENELSQVRRDGALTLDNAIKKLGYTRRFNTPKYYISFLTPKLEWVNSKPTLSPVAVSAMTLRRQLADGSADLDVPSFTIFGETFEPRMPARVNMLRSTAIAAGYKIASPSGLFTNVREPFRITFKEVFGKEKHVQNMVLGNMAMHVFGMTMANSVIGHTQCTEEFLHSAWDKRLNIAMKEPASGDADLLLESMRAIRTPECMQIVNGPDNDKFKPWTYEEACLEVHKQGKGGHFDRYLDFAAAIADPEFEKAVHARLDQYCGGMAAPTYQVCRDKRETKAKKCIDGTGRLTIAREPGESEEDFQTRLKKTASIAPRNIRFAEFTQRMVDLMLLGPVQKYHAHVAKLYYGSSTGTPLWRLGNLTKALHDVYAPTHQQEFWDSSELSNHSSGDSKDQQSWFNALMNGKGKQLKDDVYIRMYDADFRRGMERRAVKTLIASGDFSGFDGTVSKTDMVLNYLFYKDVYQQRYHLTLKTRWEHWLWALVITDHGNVIISDGQRSSGDQDTSFGNTMINSIYHYRSTALALGISIKDSTKPIGEVWFRADFNYNKPTFKKVYLHRITHISDGDDNLHFGSEADIKLFDANGPAFLERCGKKIRCGTRSGYQISEGYSGLSYCSHSYVRSRIGFLDIDKGQGPVRTPIDITPFGQRKVDHSNLPKQHAKDLNLGLRVQYLPMRPIPEIIGKLVYTLKSSTTSMDLVRDYGPSSKETKRGIKNEDAIAITRGKLLSYMLNYAHINVVRILCMSALSVIGDGVCDLKELRRRFHTPSAAASLASGLKGVFNINSLQEIESLSPSQEKDGLRAMRHNTTVQFRTCNLKRYGEVAPMSLTLLHMKCESWIQEFCINNDILPDWSFWKVADPNFVYSEGLDMEDLKAEVLPKPSRFHYREKFMANMFSFLALLSIAQPSRVAEKAPRSDEFVRECVANPEVFTQYDTVVEIPADCGTIPKNIRGLYPNLKAAVKEHITASGGPSRAIGHSFCLEGVRQKVYVVVTRKSAKHSPLECDVARALNDVGFKHELRPIEGRTTLNRLGFRSQPQRPLLLLAPRGRFSGFRAEVCLKMSCRRSLRQSLVIPI
uniref:Genome polyprotein n=1 Tax=Sonchus virus 1 TaxID=3014457 RepID=A0A9N6YK78_9FLAV|nr:TPA_asm: polyprotein [Sonchus virus 1]